MPLLHTSRLSEFVADVNARGGDLQHAEIAEKYYPLELAFDTAVDQDLSPYSEDYYRQQLDLYREVAGRELDQSEGELHPMDTTPHLTAPNPFNSWRVEDMAGHVRAISNMLCLSCLTGSPDVLDMGAGHGLSSEVMAFTGCKVHAVDIDPVLGELSRRRAAARGLLIQRSDLNFDDIGPIENGKYAAAYFFQSFHHCLRPWDLIAQLKPKLKAEGVIGFAGEPIQSQWWRNWGLRLDDLSVYVARHHGWFESGWSHAFIRDCFERSGMTLNFFTGGFFGEIGIATADPAKREAVLAQATSLGLSETQAPGCLDVADDRYQSTIGVRTPFYVRSGFRQAAPGGGMLLYGPYLTIDAGRYEISLIVEHTEGDGDGAPGIVLDVVGDFGKTVFFRERIEASQAASPQLLVRSVDIGRDTTGLEIRTAVEGSGLWSVSLPAIRRSAAGQLAPTETVSRAPDAPTDLTLAQRWRKRLGFQRHP